jgi:hypothetical protein
MSKRTVIAVLVATVAVVLPFLACDQDEQPISHTVFVMEPPETLTVARGTYWARSFPQVTPSMFGYSPEPSLNMNLQCVGTFPDSNPKWYLFNSDQYSDFQAGLPNQQFMSAAANASGCTMWVALSSTETGTYWAVIDNRRDPTHDIRVVGHVYLNWYGL